MSKSTSARFFVRIGERHLRICSVKENKDGSLLFYSAHPRRIEPLAGTHEHDLIEQHYSIHLSNDERDSTITQKTKFISGEISNVAFVPDAVNLLWPIQARRVGTYRADSRWWSATLPSDGIEAGQYHPERATFFYSVFVCNTRVVPAITRSLVAERHHIKQFSKLAVVLIPAYLNIPTIPSGDVAVLSTSSTVIDGIKLDNHYQLKTDPLPPDLLLVVNDHLKLSLINMMHERMKKLGLLEVTLSHLGTDLRHLAYTLTRYPLVGA